jgi:hypothetical protein
VTRFVVAAAAAALGLWLIYVGLTNVRTRTSEETGVRRRVNRAIGEGATYSGRRATLQGWIRVGLGVAALVFAAWFFLFGPEA